MSDRESDGIRRGFGRHSVWWCRQLLSVLETIQPAEAHSSADSTLAFNEVMSRSS